MPGVDVVELHSGALLLKVGEIAAGESEGHVRAQTQRVLEGVARDVPLPREVQGVRQVGAEESNTRTSCIHNHASSSHIVNDVTIQLNENLGW